MIQSPTTLAFRLSNKTSLSIGKRIRSTNGLLTSVKTHRLRMDFTTWVARMRTAPALVAAIQLLQAGASFEVKSALAVEEDGSFLLDVAMFEMLAA